MCDVSRSMTDIRKNAFSMLLDEDNFQNESEKAKSSTEESESTEVSTSETSTKQPTDLNDDSNWTVQSSKPRRLAPQFTLSHHDMGTDPRTRPSNPVANTTPSQETSPPLQLQPMTQKKRGNSSV